MAHKVKFSTPELDVQRADVEFSVSNEGKKMGTLKVSKGSVVWTPKDYTYGHKLSWNDFGIVMQEKGKKEK